MEKYPAYIIESEEGFWSNEYGWCFDKGSATEFTGSEAKSFQLRQRLPVGINVGFIQVRP